MIIHRRGWRRDSMAAGGKGAAVGGANNWDSAASPLEPAIIREPDEDD